MRAVDCVGALIQDQNHRVYVHRRSATRRLLPGIWDIVGGHLEPGETPEQALAREVQEETGWTVRSIRWPVADWEWEYEGRVRRELDFVVEVTGDLTRPRLELGKHDASAWVGPAELDLMMVGRTDGDRRLRDIVAHVARTRFTERLRLEPVTGPGEVLTGHQADLEVLFNDPWVAHWYAGPWSPEQALAGARTMGAAWERDQVSKWIAYELPSSPSELAPDTPPEDKRKATGPGGHYRSGGHGRGRPGERTVCESERHSFGQAEPDGSGRSRTGEAEQDGSGQGGFLRAARDGSSGAGWDAIGEAEQGGSGGSIRAARGGSSGAGRGGRGVWGGVAGREVLVGRGGLSRLGVGEPVTVAIGELVGSGWAADRLELGWALCAGARGKGYATEIGRAGLEYAFGTLGAAAVVAFTEVINTASRAVMERLGMTLVGEIHAEGLIEGSAEVHPDAPFAVYLAR